MALLLVLLYMISSAGVLYLHKRSAFARRLGEVLIACIIGLIYSLFIWLFSSYDILTQEQTATLRKTQSLICDIVIPIAIPLLLFSSKIGYLRKHFASGSKVLITGIVAVVITSVLGALLLKNYIGADTFKIAGMLAGKDTGGTPNLAALQLAFKLPLNTFIQLQAADMVICFFYLMFFFSIGKELTRKFLPKYVALGNTAEAAEQQQNSVFCWTRGTVLDMLKAFVLSILIFGIAAGSSLLIFGEIRVPFLILLLTSLSLGASVFKPIQRLQGAFDLGMFLIVIFNVSIASMVDFPTLLDTKMYYLAAYVAFVVYATVLLHMLFCKILRVDADTFMVASTALINSPPFVPVMATAIGNREVILIGMSVGMMGYALGNYVGFGVAELLKYIL
ncbi:MAG: DUF819 family protein [Bacteroidales bacterium]